MRNSIYYVETTILGVAIITSHKQFGNFFPMIKALETYEMLN
jgi:hypothetical protein